MPQGQGADHDAGSGAQPPEVELDYDDVLVIVGGGEVDLDLLGSLQAVGAHLVAADGGAEAIAAAGFDPEAIIGDFDSVGDPFAWLGRSRLIKLTEQDTTDFEKALYSTRAPVTVALGMTGRRFDHTLAAIDAASRYAAQRFIILVDSHDIALVLSGPFGHQVAAGDRVSVHPLGPIRFRRSTGLKYALNGLRLAPGERSGTSNTAIKGPFTIVPEDGETAPWLLILDRRHLMGLVEKLLVLA
jgi:thiamine pyrophosphokinase